jgi:outer membrane protein assembly factor BamD (BamD/ComL family)
MYAVVDFDRKQTHFFNSFFEASEFIAQYPVVETVVVVDMSLEAPTCELL